MDKSQLALAQLQLIKQLAGPSEYRKMLAAIGVVDSQVQDLLIEVMKSDA